MLTARECKTAQPSEKKRKLYDAGGLLLMILPSGTKSWRFKYRFGGKEKELTFGPYALLTPEKMKGWIARLIGKGPTPACEEDLAKRRKAAFEDMLAGLTATEYQRQPFNDKALLGSTLRRIAAAVDAREAKERESCSSDETGGLY